jgi:hypothetical protein
MDTTQKMLLNDKNQTAVQIGVDVGCDKLLQQSTLNTEINKQAVMVPELTG